MGASTTTTSITTNGHGPAPLDKISTSKEISTQSSTQPALPGPPRIARSSRPPPGVQDTTRSWHGDEGTWSHYSLGDNTHPVRCYPLGHGDPPCLPRLSWRRRGGASRSRLRCISLDRRWAQSKQQSGTRPSSWNGPRRRPEAHQEHKLLSYGTLEGSRKTQRAMMRRVHRPQPKSATRLSTNTTRADALPSTVSIPCSVLHAPCSWFHDDERLDKDSTQTIDDGA